MWLLIRNGRIIKWGIPKYWEKTWYCGTVHMADPTVIAVIPKPRRGQ
jgi:hypothetical protein